MGAVRGSVRSVCDRAGVQYPDPGAAAVFLLVVFDQLGAVFEVCEVSGLAQVGWCVIFSFLFLFFLFF